MISGVSLAEGLGVGVGVSAVVAVGIGVGDLGLGTAEVPWGEAGATEVEAGAVA